MTIGSTALHQAVAVGATDMVLVLLEAGAHANILNNALQTPLILAATLQLKDIMRLLLMYHADTSKRDLSGFDYAHYCTL